jgi:hypothetical protein
MENSKICNEKLGEEKYYYQKSFDFFQHPQNEYKDQSISKDAIGFSNSPIIGCEKQLNVK